MQKKNSLDSVTLKKIGKGALIAGAGAVLAFLAQNASDGNFGAYSAFLAAIISVLINTLREYNKGE
ncbi:MAG TPA: hypothetical protein VK255_03750 [Patescibacteria group bacterium]|nr:hypothetical protein [Patescibacteria group bacterium]